MAAAAHSMLSATPHSHQFLGTTRSTTADLSRRRINARIFFSSPPPPPPSPNQEDDPDCNDPECAPDKEVGKVSMEWVASEKTQVVGTYPPKRKGWTGYVEKDTAGQTNIYAVEPVVYVAESSLSSGNSGTSADGAQNTVAVAAGIGLISIAAASSLLFQVGKNEAKVQSAQITDYNGPPLSYYISKFKKPVSVVVAEAPVPTGRDLQEAPSVQTDEMDASFQSI